jgi:hypothetical protein
MKIAGETKGNARLTSNALDAPCHNVPRGADEAKCRAVENRMYPHGDNTGCGKQQLAYPPKLHRIS